MGDSIGESGFTLGTVVGQLTGIERELRQQREDRQREYAALTERLTRLERTSGNWRWLERAGAIIGGALAGWFGGKVG